MKRVAALCVLIALIGSIQGCSSRAHRSQGVYLLLDTSGAHAVEMKKAQDIIYFLLRTLQPGDTLFVSRIDTGSFSEKDIIARARFDQRPSVTNAQKRSLQKKIDAFLTSVNDNKYADISGGLLQAIESMNEADTGSKYILIFSDLEEESAKGFGRDVPLALNGFHVVVFNMTQLRDDKYDPKSYLERVGEWRQKTEKNGGQWRFINDMERLEAIMEP
jgi:hypothetical protein